MVIDLAAHYRYACFGLVYLLTAVLWLSFYFRVLDVHLRHWLGRQFGVTFRPDSHMRWQVAEPDQGMSGCLLEFSQVLFLIPAALLPLLCALLLLFFLPFQP
jgi:hypothetical protein